MTSSVAACQVGVVWASAVWYLLAPSAFLASAASTDKLTSTLLPMRLHDMPNSGIAAAMSAWSRQANSADVNFVANNLARAACLGRPVL
jgi:hypothetical protein